MAAKDLKKSVESLPMKPSVFVLMLLKRKESTKKLKISSSRKKSKIRERLSWKMVEDCRGKLMTLHESRLIDEEDVCKAINRLKRNYTLCYAFLNMEANLPLLFIRRLDKEVMQFKSSRRKLEMPKRKEMVRDSFAELTKLLEAKSITEEEMCDRVFELGKRCNRCSAEKDPKESAKPLPSKPRKVHPGNASKSSSAAESSLQRKTSRKKSKTPKIDTGKMVTYSYRELKKHVEAKSITRKEMNRALLVLEKDFKLCQLFLKITSESSRVTFIKRLIQESGGTRE